MKISPSSQRKRAYPTLASLTAGAIMLASSSCQQQVTGTVPSTNMPEEPLHTGGDVPYTPPSKENILPRQATPPKREPQAVIGRARTAPVTQSEEENTRARQPQRIGGKHPLHFRVKPKKAE
ncbi:MAG: hypothetical protein E7031_06800 [Akkermansiaceae bacterium]|nr:hypothetical protein [Akkermansiaceae bacterium]